MTEEQIQKAISLVWDKAHYKECRDFMKARLEGRPILSNVESPFEWAKIFLPLISQAIHDENYEAAKGFSDAIRTFVNRFLPKGKKITKKDTLMLPEFKQIKVHGILCFGDPNDPAGIAGTGVII